MSLLLDYSFLTVALGTCLLAAATSLIGSISVLTNQSLIGDTLGQAAYPGIIFSFMVFQSRNPLLLTLGAIFSGYISYALVEWIVAHSRHTRVNTLALVSSAFFGLGMVMKQFVQGNPVYQRAAQTGLQTYLFGQAAFIKADDLILIASVSISCIILFCLFYQSYRIYLFDPILARLGGLNTGRLKHLTIFMMICLIAVGLKAVGAILISSFLIAPAITGMLWKRTYKGTLLVSLICAISSAFLGTYFSSFISGLATGPAIIICMTSLALLAFFRHYFKKFKRR